MSAKEEKTESNIIIKSWHFVASQIVLMITVIGTIFGAYNYAMADLDNRYNKEYYPKDKGEKLEAISEQLSILVKSQVEIQKSFTENSDDYHTGILKIPFRNGKPVSDEYAKHNAFTDLRNDVDKIKNQTKVN